MDKQAGNIITKAYELIPRKARPAAITTVATGLLGGAATVGYNVGQHRGARRTADAMTSAFGAANQIENEQIANTFYNRGLHDSTKTASDLEQVYNEAFNDEMNKIAVGWSSMAMGAIKGAGTAIKGLATRTAAGAKTEAGNLKNAWSGGSGIKESLQSAWKGPKNNPFSNASRGQHMMAAGKKLWQAAPGLTTAGVATGALGTGLALGGKKND